LSISCHLTWAIRHANRIVWIALALIPTRTVLRAQEKLHVPELPIPTSIVQNYLAGSFACPAGSLSEMSWMPPGTPELSFDQSGHWTLSTGLKGSYQLQNGVITLEWQPKFSRDYNGVLQPGSWEEFIKFKLHREGNMVKLESIDRPWNGIHTCRQPYQTLEVPVSRRWWKTMCSPTHAPYSLCLPPTWD